MCDRIVEKESASWTLEHSNQFQEQSLTRCTSSVLPCLWRQIDMECAPLGSWLVVTEVAVARRSQPRLKGCTVTSSPSGVNMATRLPSFGVWGQEGSADWLRGLPPVSASDRVPASFGTRRRGSVVPGASRGAAERADSGVCTLLTSSLPDNDLGSQPLRIEWSKR